MFSDTARKPANLHDTEEVSTKPDSLLTRKIWLPKAIYSALPYFYLITGVLALLAALYISHWLWILPHYVLFAAACIHMGALIMRRRRRGRQEDD